MAETHVLLPIVEEFPDAAIERAVELLDADRVTVYNVVTPLDAGMSEGGVLASTEDRLAEAARVAEQRAAVARRETGADVAVESTAVSGSPVETVVERATADDVDGVVLDGTGGSAKLRRLFGTTPRAIEAEAPVPVTILD